MGGERMRGHWPYTGVCSIMVLLCFAILDCDAKTTGQQDHQEETKNIVMEVKNGPESVIWIVQLSDLHFSVHNPEKALDFKSLVGPALAMINPSLVFITGDLTDGKSKDLLVMKQNEDEWIEYKNIMEDVLERSGLDKSIFYDLRGNHDSFGVPKVGDSVDFFSKHSINGQLGRTGHVNSVTVETIERKHLFVGVDSTMHVGLRGPTNLFGHPTDKLLHELDSELSQWDSQSTKPVTKISFGHFPLSFSASSESGKDLKDIFLKHSISAYLCGHLHARFGKNLKRLHQSLDGTISANKLFQLNMQQIPTENSINCSFGASPAEEFWEWEMGDWRKSRAMRVLAIDRGHVSYVDINFRSGAKKTIILPTFPLDSRFMSTSPSNHIYECQHMVPSSYDTVRALVFSVSQIVSVVVKIYDSSPGFLAVVMEASMNKLAEASPRGDLYAVPWNYRAFEDPSPDRYWLQIEATAITGQRTLTKLRPFSVNGMNNKISWTWKEFYVMGCQWAALYYPILWCVLYSLFFILLIPKCLLVFKKQYTYKNFAAKTGIINGVAWILQGLCRIPVVWFGLLGYLFYLILLPWFSGKVFTDTEDRAYMTYMGWVIKTSNDSEKHEYVGSPDIMVLVIPHIILVILPTILVCGALPAEREVYMEHFKVLSGKKEDDYDRVNKRIHFSRFLLRRRWIRKILLLVSFAVFWKHFMNCRSLIKAYEMNPLLHFPVYSLAIPLLLGYAIYDTERV